MEYGTDNQNGYGSYSPGSEGRTEYLSGNAARMEYGTDNQNGYGNSYSSGNTERTEYSSGNTGRTEYNSGSTGRTEYSPGTAGRTGYSQENENRTEYGAGTRSLTGYQGRDGDRAAAGGRTEYLPEAESGISYREVHSPKTGRSEPLPQPDPDTELSPETTFLGETTFLPGLQAEAAAGPRLVPMKKGKGKEAAVKPLPFLIGTLSGEANLLLPGHSVSRIHARIEEEDGQYMIVDCRSTNGTWVNGIRLRPEERYPLREGDVIRFADIKMRFK